MARKKIAVAIALKGSRRTRSASWARSGPALRSGYDESALGSVAIAWSMDMRPMMPRTAVEPDDATCAHLRPDATVAIPTLPYSTLNGGQTCTSTRRHLHARGSSSWRNHDANRQLREQGELERQAG